ncbi:MAG: hypothetical protein Q6358_09550 [Candidatus Brocadiales bacterium]|nr:hypothetical protein [Candidatus Brocadiales bacterium]
MSISNSKIPLFCQIILARELTLKRPSHELKKLNQTLASSTVDLNPHEIDAALFAFNCPLSRGAILCGEVGLGKIVEAWLIINQFWAVGTVPALDSNVYLNAFKKGNIRGARTLLNTGKRKRDQKTNE